MDIWEVITIVAATVGIQSLLIVFLGNRFLKFAFDNLDSLISPTVRKAFGILGGVSGDARRQKAIADELAGGALDATIGKYKPILGMIGIDLDDMMSKYTPMEILGAVQTFLPMLKNMGIDPSKLLAGITGGDQQPQPSNTKLGDIGT